MLIHLLRHGVAEDMRFDHRDDLRELTEEGHERLRLAAKAWREIAEAPLELWMSPLTRARQTAEVFAKAVRFEGEMQEFEQLRPEEPVLRVVELLEKALLGGVGSVALVGHEPQLGALFAYLLHGRDGLAIPLRKGMLVTVETHGSTNLTAQLRVALGQRNAARLA
jgi:phosphohistidine phosphatase